MKNFNAVTVLLEFLLLFIIHPKNGLISVHSPVLQQDVNVASARGGVTPGRGQNTVWILGTVTPALWQVPRTAEAFEATSCIHEGEVQ